MLIVGREEKRQTLDMIPMGVRNQKSQLDWPGAEFLFQGDSQLAHAGAGVEDDDLAVGPHLDAAGISAIADRG